MKSDKPVIKRFFKTVSCQPEGRSWIVMLDEKTLRTPARSVLRLPTKALAELVAAEWEAQTEAIRPDFMPISRLANVAHDHMGMNKAASAGELVRFAASDLLCFRVAEPLDLQELQVKEWDIWLDWAEEKFGARLGVSTSLTPPDIPLDALENMRNAALNMEPFALTAMLHASALLGSCVLGFALLDAKLGAQQAFDLSRIEEDWQIQQWGEDEEAKARADGLLAFLEASTRFMLAAQE
ncbi:MAG: ATPase [Robiginitomaculum sp.]|nr:MAG: ATPase [Robiginitomaculum sp.]